MAHTIRPHSRHHTHPIPALAGAAAGAYGEVAGSRSHSPRSGSLLPPYHASGRARPNPRYGLHSAGPRITDQANGNDRWLIAMRFETTLDQTGLGRDERQTSFGDSNAERRGYGMTKHKVATREEWLAARGELLARGKELTRRNDEPAAERRAPPW